MDIVSLKNVYLDYYTTKSEINVLDNINIDVKEGEIVCIVGPSGCGKSTILNVISGLVKPNKGEVIVNGKCGYMFQKDNLFEWRTVYKNVLLGLELTGCCNEVNKKRALNLLEKYGLLEFKDYYPSQLSGGQRQRVALIRTLLLDPDILLLDESFSALDFQTRLLVNEDVYKIIKEEKKTAIIVTHDISEAISMGDRVLVLSSRPAKVKKGYDIRLSINGSRTPLKSRDALEFKEYFQLIWKEMN